MKPLHWIIIAVAVLACLFSFYSCSKSAPTLDQQIQEATYNFKCGACDKESEFTTTMLEDFKKSGRAEAVSGKPLKVECPHCTEIEASHYEPYDPRQFGD